MHVIKTHGTEMTMKAPIRVPVFKMGNDVPVSEASGTFAAGTISVNKCSKLCCKVGVFRKFERKFPLH